MSTRSMPRVSVVKTTCGTFNRKRKTPSRVYSRKKNLYKGYRVGRWVEVLSSAAFAAYLMAIARLRQRSSTIMVGTVGFYRAGPLDSRCCFGRELRSEDFLRM